MSIVDDIGYGRQFEGWYDRLFPDREQAEETARVLASLHPDPAAGTVELGVGTGRIAIPLSRLVGPVTGLDSSPEMLDALKRNVGDAPVTGVHADMRVYSGTRRYGLAYAVCGTLSQLLTRADQGRAVRRAADLLVPGGRLVLEVHNLPAVVALHEGRRRTTVFTPYPEPGTGLQTHATLLVEHGLWQCSQVWYEKDGTTRVGTETALLSTPGDIDALAAEAGLERLACHGAWDGSAYHEEAPTFVGVYGRPG